MLHYNIFFCCAESMLCVQVVVVLLFSISDVLCHSSYHAALGCCTLSCLSATLSLHARLSKVALPEHTLQILQLIACKVLRKLAHILNRTKSHDKKLTF